jgi:GNAT superfamily N-acetyltransferase
MLILPVTAEDIPAIRDLIEATIRTSVTRSADEANFLVGDIGASLDWWGANPAQAVHLKALSDGTLAGVILVKDFWNLTNLFVAPAYQSQGIGRQLLTAALDRCRPQSPRPALLVHSSTVAVEFYQRMGFVANGEPRDRPGGCVPLRYDW